MSQKKVDSYKQEKQNRKASAAKKKRQMQGLRIAVVVVCAAFIVWIGYSIGVHLIPDKSNPSNNKTSDESHFDAKELADLLAELDAATDTDATDTDAN